MSKNVSVIRSITKLIRKEIDRQKDITNNSTLLYKAGADLKATDLGVLSK